MNNLELLLKEAEDKVREGESNLAKECGVGDIRELHFELTYQCNEQCAMCDVWPRYRKNPELRQKELATEEIFRLADKSAYLKNLKLVLFSGGEPFLRKDLPDLCNFFIQRNKMISVGVLSNLFATDLVFRTVGQILEYRPMDFWIGSSIDGLYERHDAMRGVKGCFSALERSVLKLKKEFPHVRLSLNFTITPDNHSELLNVYEYAKSIDTSFSAQIVVPWKDAKSFEWTAETMSAVRESIYQIMRRTAADYERNLGLKVIDKATGSNLRRQLLSSLFYWNGIIKYQQKPARRFERCVAGTRFVQVSPSGDIYFCPLLKERIIGNIRDANYRFDDLWISEKSVKLREFINTAQCHCWLNCTIYPNVQEALGSAVTGIRRKFMIWGWNKLQKLRGRRTRTMRTNESMPTGR